MFTSLAALTFGAQIGHYMFRGPIAKAVGVENIPLADRRLALDLNLTINLTSIIMMDRIDDLDAFAVRVRNHFMQWDRCRSQIIRCGNHFFFEKVEAENMVEILDEMTEKEGIAFMEKTQTAPFTDGEAWHKVYLIPSGDKLMIVSKTDHAICDGLSMIHMWSLL